jgi:hypothetical protein
LHENPGLRQSTFHETHTENCARFGWFSDVVPFHSAIPPFAAGPAGEVAADRLLDLDDQFDFNHRPERQ